MSPFNQAMLMLAKQPNVLFVGQGVGDGGDGVATYRDMDGVPMAQRIEFPVSEELQLGACVGLAMQGYLPVCVYPRIDFMMRAMDQLVNHLDKIEQMSCGQWKPKVIIRTRVGSKRPLDAGPQHTQNHSRALWEMLKNVDVFEVEREQDVMATYRDALMNERSTIVVEAIC